MKLMVVIVTYRKNFLDTPSAETLLKFSKEKLIQLVVYDNECVGNEITETNVINIRSEKNLGLAVAYNFALSQARKDNTKWLLLLDDDTTITAEYLRSILEFHTSAPVKAFLPTVISENTIISPLKADRYISLREKAIPISGLSDDKIMAINSGTVLSVEKLVEIGGFNESFSLDFLDHWIFWRLNQEKDMKYFISTHQINHKLSVQSLNTLDFDRYLGILQSEFLFYTQYDREKLSEYKKNLFFRTIKHFLLIRNRKFWRATLKAYFSLKNY
ncbi:glycosyltransferase [Lapidilactobacillus wuchangensis]|uniref:glycosyltransferase n=1 Tax=Lapidilactobacillus wuchangensis TaxID=2486001 RepID=UPI000F79BCAF|nr:glycosyltransferase [Lapidilactobacillus wuchangensis]